MIWYILLKRYTLHAHSVIEVYLLLLLLQSIEFGSKRIKSSCSVVVSMLWFLFHANEDKKTEANCTVHTTLVPFTRILSFPKWSLVSIALARLVSQPDPERIKKINLRLVVSVQRLRRPCTYLRVQCRACCSGWNQPIEINLFASRRPKEKANWDEE